MKEAIGGSYLFMLVIIMVAVFTSYVSLSTNYSRCYKIKDEIINTIEAEGAVNEKTIEKINQYLNNIGYRSSSPDCRDDNTSTRKFVVTKTSFQTSGPANYCISRVVTNNKKMTGHPGSGSYYKVTVFFKLGIPLFGEIFLIPITGETAILFASNEYNENLWKNE